MLAIYKNGKQPYYAVSKGLNVNLKCLENRHLQGGFYCYSLGIEYLTEAAD